MALLHVDWNPGTRKIRVFGLILTALAILFGHAAAPVGVALGLLSVFLPGSAGLWIYKTWMGVAFVIGSIASPILLGLIYFGLFTPLALIMRVIGRDALRLKRPQVDSYWTPMAMPDDKTYYERLF